MSKRWDSGQRAIHVIERCGLLQVVEIQTKADDFQKESDMVDKA